LKECKILSSDVKVKVSCLATCLYWRWLHWQPCHWSQYFRNG